MRIPKQAKRVFKGVIFDVYQWKQKMFDGSTAVFEMLKRKNTVQVIATEGKKILIAKERQSDRPKPFYTLFCGRLDKNEKPLTGAKRELLEESGLSSDDWELLGIDNPYGKIEWTVYSFVARNCHYTAKSSFDPGEKIEVIPISFNKFVKMIENDQIRIGNLGFNILKMKLDDKLGTFKKQLFKPTRTYADYAD